MYLSTSKLAVAAVGNLSFAMALCMYNLVIKVGRRDAEEGKGDVQQRQEGSIGWAGRQHTFGGWDAAGSSQM